MQTELAVPVSRRIRAACGHLAWPSGSRILAPISRKMCNAIVVLPASLLVRVRVARKSMLDIPHVTCATACDRCTLHEDMRDVRAKEASRQTCQHEGQDYD